MPESRHYASLVQLGKYNELFPTLSTESNFHINVNVRGLALDRVDDDALALADELNPTTASPEGLLPDWERLAGILPNDLTPVGDRRTAVVAQLRARGGLSAAHFKSIAAALGYNYGEGAAQPRVWFVEGSAFVPFRAGISAAGDKVFGPDADHHDHLVVVYGTDIENDLGLINLFNKNHAVGITFDFRSE